MAAARLDAALWELERRLLRSEPSWRRALVAAGPAEQQRRPRSSHPGAPGEAGASAANVHARRRSLWGRLRVFLGV